MWDFPRADADGTVQTFFGMNFFDYENDSQRMVGTTMVWIFVVAAVVLTGVTFGFYYGLLHKQDSPIFRRLAPKARLAADWHIPIRSLKNHLGHRPGEAGTGGGLSPGIQLQPV